MSYSYVEEPTERLLSLDPATFGFGFVVLEYEPLRLVGWGTKRCRTSDSSTIRAIRELVEVYAPTALVLPDWRETRHAFRGPALERFIESAGSVLNSPDLPVLIVGPEQIAEHFAGEAKTKHEIACYLARRFPELGPITPPKRLVFETERPVMAVFDALAMAIATRSPTSAE